MQSWGVRLTRDEDPEVWQVRLTYLDHESLERSILFDQIVLWDLEAVISMLQSSADALVRSLHYTTPLRQEMWPEYLVAP